MNQDDYGPIILFAVVATAILALLVREVRRHRVKLEIYNGGDLHSIAQAVGGEVARDPSFAGSFVRFSAEGVRCYCHQRMLNQTQFVVITTLEAKARFPGFLEATSIGAIRYPMQSPRFHRLPIVGNFHLVTTDSQWGGRMLASGLGDILRDPTLGRFRGLRLHLTGDRTSLEVEERLRGPELRDLVGVLARLIRLSRDAVDSTGITFEGDVAVTEKGRCPVCSQGFTQSQLHCELCSAPHHADCWAYWGRCAIFGCSGRRAA